MLYTEENLNLSNKNNKTNLMGEEKNIKDEESPRNLIKKQEITLKIKEELNRKISRSNYLLYGNQINNLHPKYLGNSRALFYINNYPIITIGPDCKYHL